MTLSGGFAVNLGANLAKATKLKWVPLALRYATTIIGIRKSANPAFHTVKTILHP